MILESLTITPAELKSRTDWDIKPQGACKGEICIPLPSSVTTSAGLIDVPKLGRKAQYAAYTR